MDLGVIDDDVTGSSDVGPTLAAGCPRTVRYVGVISGAVVTALGAEAFEIGPTIDPDVPALRVAKGGAHDDLAVALKSGNVGRETFFAHASATTAGET